MRFFNGRLRQFLGILNGNVTHCLDDRFALGQADPAETVQGNLGSLHSLVSRGKHAAIMSGARQRTLTVAYLGQNLLDNGLDL
jgi:hypothetical protein